jgi:elongation factor Ts
MKIPTRQIKKLRAETGAPILRVKKILEEVSGDEKKAFAILRKEGFEKAVKRAGRQTKQGIVVNYMHHNNKIASMVEVLCETDFVAKNELFRQLAHDLAMQIASLDPKDVKELERQEFIKDPTKKIGDLVKEVIAKTGENIKIGRFYRVEIGN